MKNFFENKIARWLAESLAIFFIILAILAMGYFVFEKMYKNKIYPGVKLGDMNLSGKTCAEAYYLISQKINRINQAGIIFSYGGRKMVLTPVVSSLESDLAYEIINFNEKETTRQACNFGRSGNFTAGLAEKIKLILNGEEISAAFSLNEKKITEALKENFEKFEEAPLDANLVYKNGEFKITAENTGKVIDYNKGLKALSFNLNQLNNSPIELFSRSENPKIYRGDIAGAEKTAERILAAAPLTLKLPALATSTAAKLKNPGKEWQVTKNELGGWLVIKPAGRNYADGKKSAIGIDYAEAEKFLTENVSPDVNVEPLLAKFEIKDGRVSEFQASRDGFELNIPATLKKIEADLIDNKQSEIKLAAKEIKSNVNMENINNLGVREIIGTGHSNFSGSPANRRHNIRNGADTLNGILIKPNEEFSLLKTLGEIDAKAGYLPELVIKDSKTVPEYGGGLCQIGTTLFRATLASGLSVTMRKNHSYRVSYYEPAGTDATIYNPAPDYKFLNDTGNYILIQSRIEGDDLYFDFWGTKDGRATKMTEPTIYNIVKPAPTKFIETLDLAPGEKKCTEHAHNGADAYFDYAIVYADGKKIEKRFSSHYVPWREVCLIGTEKLTSEEDKTASSTKETVAE